ncbi:MAG: SDH family Clp fold serine proteinase [Syntrophomonadaceae bacterium]|jgi:ClpP class serine protease
MQLDFGSLIWLMFLLMAFLPVLKQRRILATRLAFLRRIELERKSRVITLIHRQESLSFLGIPLRRFIDMEDSEKVLRAIRMTPDDMPIDIILHTPGGIALAAEQIARALKKHPAKVTAIIPHYAMSGGTLIALAADEILLDENAVLGPIDPQIAQYPASSIIRVLREKPIEDIDDETIILADMAEKATNQIFETAVDVMTPRLDEEAARNLAQILSEGRWTHDFALVCSTLSQLGLPVNCNLPDYIYELMDLFPQPARQIPSVEYIPVPYRRPAKGQSLT